MNQGLYKYVSDEIWNQGYVIIKLKETQKLYCLTLIENTIRYSPAQIDMLFQKSNFVKINKKKSPHVFLTWSDCEFTVYPYRAGIPFYFEQIKGKI